MADDILLKVKEAEDKAAMSVADAKEASTQILTDAKTTAANDYKRIINDANVKANDLIDEATRSAQAEKEPILAKAREASEEIANVNKTEIDKVVNKLTERIIRDGNS